MAQANVGIIASQLHKREFMNTTADSANHAPGVNFDVSHLQHDANKRRLRERYIQARFPQFSESNTSLRNTKEVLRWARQFLDDDRSGPAIELLELSLEEDATQREVWLFLIEHAFLNSDAPRVSELAAEYAMRFGRDDATAVIEAMGHELSPNDPQFLHVTQTAELPNWSSFAAAGHDEAMQRKYHAALLRTAAYHLGR